MMQRKIDQIANLWNKTKDPEYKNEWYKLVEKTYGQRDNTNTSPYKRRVKSTIISLRRHSNGVL
mgnify:CR=1 FL=1